MAALNKRSDVFGGEYDYMGHSVLFVSAIRCEVVQVGILAMKRPSLSRLTTAQYQTL